MANTASNVERSRYRSRKNPSNIQYFSAEEIDLFERQFGKGVMEPFPEAKPKDVKESAGSGTKENSK